MHATPALAHAADWSPGDPWWTAWNLDPLLLAMLFTAGGLYALGARQMWRRAGPGRGVSRRQWVAFWLGIMSLGLALVSPVDTLSAHLSSAHMVQHKILMMVAAPLLVIGAPAAAWLWSLPPRWRPTLGGALHGVEAWPARQYLLWQPLVLWLLFALTLWIWHLPSLYEAALRNRWIHDLQHLMFLLAACLFWRVLLDPLSRLRLSRGLGVLYLFTTSLHAMFLGVFMTVSPSLWYRPYATTVPAWGITAMEDQQLAGIIMWMPACVIYAIAAAVVFALWLRELEPRAQRQEGGAS
jgi:putative membrane protein